MEDKREITTVLDSILPENSIPAGCVKGELVKLRFAVGKEEGSLELVRRRCREQFRDFIGVHPFRYCVVNYRLADAIEGAVREWFVLLRVESHRPAK